MRRRRRTCTSCLQPSAPTPFLEKSAAAHLQCTCADRDAASQTERTQRWHSCLRQSATQCCWHSQAQGQAGCPARILHWRHCGCPMQCKPALHQPKCILHCASCTGATALPANSAASASPTQASAPVVEGESIHDIGKALIAQVLSRDVRGLWQGSDDYFTASHARRWRSGLARRRLLGRLDQEAHGD